MSIHFQTTAAWFSGNAGWKINRWQITFSASYTLGQGQNERDNDNNVVGEDIQKGYQISRQAVEPREPETDNTIMTPREEF